MPCFIRNKPDALHHCATLPIVRVSFAYRPHIARIARASLVRRPIICPAKCARPTTKKRRARGPLMRAWCVAQGPGLSENRRVRRRWGPRDVCTRGPAHLRALVCIYFVSTFDASYSFNEKFDLCLGLLGAANRSPKKHILGQCGVRLKSHARQSSMEESLFTFGRQSIFFTYGVSLFISTNFLT